MAIKSYNEFVNTCAQAAEVIGIKWGSNHDLAELVYWLEVNGFHGLQRFERGLLQGHISQPHQLSTHFSQHLSPGLLVLDAKGQSIATFSMACVDNARAALTEHLDYKITINNAKDSLFIVAAFSRITLPASILIQGIDSGDRFVYVKNEGHEAITWFGDAKTGESNPSAINIHLDHQDALLSIYNPRSASNQRSIDITDQQSTVYQKGITVDDDQWNRVYAAATRILVPNTEQSQKRGAGGGEAND